MKLDIRILAGLALAFAAPAAARADDEPFVTAKISAAAANISSFVIASTISGTTGVTSQTTFVRPQKLKSVATIGTLTVESYVVGGTIYIHSPLTGWQKMSLDQVKSSPAAINIADSLKTAKVDYLPDRVENGTTVGVFVVATPDLGGASTLPTPGGTSGSPVPKQTLTCTYDKSTFLTRTCSNAMMSLTYSKYNDPANVVELPADAKNAAPLLLPQPAAAQAVPAPAPSPQP